MNNHSCNKGENIQNFAIKNTLFQLSNRKQNIKKRKTIAKFGTLV